MQEIEGAFKNYDGSMVYIGITEGMFSTYMGEDEKVRYATTIEAPYYGEPDNMMTDQSYIKSGVAFARAVKQLIKELDVE